MVKRYAKVVGLVLWRLVTWRNILRGSGLSGMVWQISVHPHPDPTVLLALAAMMGLPTYLGFENFVKSQRGDREEKDEP